MPDIWLQIVDSHSAIAKVLGKVIDASCWQEKLLLLLLLVAPCMTMLTSLMIYLVSISTHCGYWDESTILMFWVAAMTCSASEAAHQAAQIHLACACHDLICTCSCNLENNVALDDIFRPQANLQQGI